MGFFSRWASFGHGLLLEISFANSRGGLLFEMSFLLEIPFANSRGGLLFKMTVANIEIDDFKTMSKTK